MADRLPSGRASRAAHLVAVTMIALLLQDGATARPNIELGRYLATVCLTCHRGAAAATAIPNIFGMAAPRFTVLIKAYRDKQLPNPVMQNIAGRLNDEDIEALAAYFAETKRP